MPHETTNLKVRLLPGRPASATALRPSRRHNIWVLTQCFENWRVGREERQTARAVFVKK